MKIVVNPKPLPAEDVPVVDATPIAAVREEIARARVTPARATVSSSDAAAISFLRQFRVLVGAARLYHRNHPRLMEILASAEQQLRVVLSLQSPLVFAVEHSGILLPRYDTKAGELLNDPRGELRTLAEELHGILEDQFVDGFRAVAALAHFERRFRHRQRIAHAPIAGAVHPQSFLAINFHHVNRPGRRAFRFGIERHAGPHPGVQHELDGMFLHVVNDDPLGLDAFIIPDRVQNEPRAFQFIFQMGGVDEDELVGTRRQVQVQLQDF